MLRNGRNLGRCLDGRMPEGEIFFVRYILREVNPLRALDGSEAGFHLEFLLSKRQRSGVTGRRRRKRRHLERNSVSSEEKETGEFLRNYLETHALLALPTLSLPLPLSDCPCLFTSCRCWNKLALERGATVAAAAVIEYLSLSSAEKRGEKAA